MKIYSATHVVPASAGRAPDRPNARQPTDRGFILIGVLVLVMLISMIAVSLMFRLRADETAAAASAGGDQSFAAAMTGVQEAMRIIAESKPGVTDWEDMPREFKDRFVYEDGSDRWHFTIWSAADYDTPGEARFGLTAESSKINVNATSQRDLTKLPNVTPQMAAALKDFVDFDDIATPDGAEQDYYNGLPEPYTIRNGALVSVDSLLQVRGFTPMLLYGEDANMNWRLDPSESEGNSGENSGFGLRRFFTTFSSEPDEDNDGVPRTNLNDPTDPFPGVEFPPAMTNFIAALRTSNQTLTHAAELLEGTITVKDEKGAPAQVASGVGKTELPQALDLFTTSALLRNDGLVNVNTAPIEVLTTVPGIDETLAEAILSTRKSVSPERRGTIAWLFQEDVVDAVTFKKIAPHLTARSFQFSFQVIGYGFPSGRFRRLEVVIDSSELKPRVVYLRDLTRLGLPFKLEPQTETPAQARKVKPVLFNRG